MENQTKELLARIVVAGIIAWLFALIPMCSHAEGLTPDQGTLVLWRGADYACRDNPERNAAACTRRDRYASTLERHGYEQLRFDVWASPDERMAFALVMRNSPHGDSVVDAVHRAIADLRAFIPEDDVIVGLWREHGTTAHSTAAWAVLREAVHQIAATHAANDVRFRLD